MDKTERLPKNLLTSVFSVYFCIDGHGTRGNTLTPLPSWRRDIRHLLSAKTDPFRSGDCGSPHSAEAEPQ